MVPPQASVLEIGAGYCDWINSTRAATRLAVDIWPGVAAHAGAGVATKVLDAATDLPSLGREAFDVVLASNVLEHFAPDVAAKIVGDVAALLRPGGRFIVIQPNFRYAAREYFDDYTHRAIFTDRSLTALLAAHGFVVERVEAKFLPYSMQRRRLPVTSWLIKAYLGSPFRPLAGQMLVVGRKG
jgi:SAM-dependent methyltransferase